MVTLQDKIVALVCVFVVMAVVVLVLKYLQNVALENFMFGMGGLGGRGRNLRTMGLKAMKDAIKFTQKASNAETHLELARAGECRRAGGEWNTGSQACAYPIDESTDDDDTESTSV